MSSTDFERYVQTVISEISVGHNSKIYQNLKYPGIRQPGSYEVDISIEFIIREALFFLVIVECKNWSKPVDRPVIQKLIQTRDAIGAHKAVVVSPTGFTREANEVARANGVALWVIGSEGCLEQNGVIGAMHRSHGLSKIIAELQCELYAVFTQYVGLRPVKSSVSSGISMSQVGSTRPVPRLVKWNRYFKRKRYPFFSAEFTEVVSEFGITELLPKFAETAIHDDQNNPVKEAILLWRENALTRLEKAGIRRGVCDLIVDEPLIDGVNQNWSKIRACYSDVDEADWWKIGDRLYDSFERARVF